MLQPITPPPMITISLREGTSVMAATVLVGRCPGLGGEREREAEGGALPGLRVDPDPAMMSADHRRDDRQAQPGPASRPGPGPVGAVEPLEDAFFLLVGQASAMVGDLEDDGGLAVGAGADFGSRRLCGPGPRAVAVAE